MAKVFVCDCCGEVVKDPFGVKFREYTRSLGFYGDRISNASEIKENTIDLCRKCYSNLNDVRKNLDYKKVQAAYNVLIHARDRAYDKVFGNTGENIDADGFAEAITDAIGYLGEVLE